jgi:O-methyltransferase involved in polyketide biosynthesis
MQNIVKEHPNGLEGINKTLLLPLWARARESQQPNPIIMDNQAQQIVENLSATPSHKNSFDEMDKVFDRYYKLSQLIRAECLDNEIKEFLTTHPCGTIVNIGAGLDTTFARVDNGLLNWYDLDLPEVIALRHEYIPETDRNRYIAKSVLDTSWFEDIGEVGNGVMFVSCGVLFFLQKDQVKKLFIELTDRFPGSEAAFDTMSRIFLMIGNRSVLRRSGMDNQAVMQWSISSAREMTKWDKRITIVAEYPMFSRIQLDASWGKTITNRMRMINRMKGINIFHLRLNMS